MAPSVDAALDAGAQISEPSLRFRRWHRMKKKNGNGQQRLYSARMLQRCDSGAQEEGCSPGQQQLVEADAHQSAFCCSAQIIK